MLSKATVKFIKSLQVKKYRKQEQCFLIEGAKSVQELLASDFEIVKLLGTESFLANVTLPLKGDVTALSEKELGSLGAFQSNNAALAIARQKPNVRLVPGPDTYALVLDDIRDPGNLGTIIRTADWYGISHIIASSETADFYNPKVISATMGSFTRVNIFYTALETYLSSATRPVYGAALAGTAVHSVNFSKGGYILVGSESHGIAPGLERFITEQITIPRYGQAESLNAAMAAGIIMDNMRRHHHA